MAVLIRLFEAGRSCLERERHLASGQVTVSGELETSSGRRLLSFYRKEGRRKIKANKMKFHATLGRELGCRRLVVERSGRRGGMEGVSLVPKKVTYTDELPLYPDWM